MLTRIIFFILFWCWGVCLQAQQCEWLEVGGSSDDEWLYHVATDNDTNVIVVGHYRKGFSIGPYTLPSSTNYSGLLLKYDTYGNIQWVKNFTFSGAQYFATSVTTDNGNNIYITGVINGTVNFGNGISVTGYGSFIVKFNPNGLALWATFYDKIYGSYAHHLVIDKAENVYVAFNFSGTITFQGTSRTIVTSNYTNIGIAKFTSSGVFINAVSFGNSTCHDDIGDLGIDNKNNLYLLGTCMGSFNFGSQMLGDTGEIILKLDSSLTPIKGYFADLNLKNLLGNNHGIAVCDNGKFAVTGNFCDSVNFGNGVWLKEYTSAPLNINSMSVVFYDSALNAIWARKNDTISGQSRIAPIGGVSTRNGNIYFGGWGMGASTRFGNSILNFTTTPKLFVTKMDTLGNVLWAFVNPNIAGTADMTGCEADVRGDAIILGNFDTTLSVFDKSKNGFGNRDFYVAKITDYEITRGFVKSGPYCAGDSIKIPFTVNGLYHPGNEFIAQLSDSAGNFDGGERELGRVKDTAGGIINGNVPLFNVATTNKYRIRILSTKPTVQSYYKKDTLRLLIYSKDTANAGPDILACKGQNIRLGTTGGSRWNWSPVIFMPDAKDSANRQPLVKPDSAIEYRVIISDSSGCGVTDTDYVKITVRPPLKISVPDTIVFCKGKPLTITAIPSGGDSSRYYFIWTDLTKNVLSLTNKLTVSPSLLTFYTLTFGDSCSPKPITVKIFAKPDTTFVMPVISDTTICTGQSIIIDANATACNSAAVKYSWDNGLGPGAIKLLKPAITTTYTITVTDTFNNKTKITAFKITVLPSLKITVNPDTTICTGQTAQLRATTTGGNSATHKILWTVDSGPWTDTNKTVTVSPSNTTTYTATLSDGCTVNSDSAKITVIVRPPLKVTVNPDTTICIGESAQLRTTISGGNVPAHSVLWTVDNGPWTSNKLTETVSPIITSVYKVVLTDNCTINPDSAKITITVRPPLKVTVNKDTTICTGQTAQLRATATGGNTSTHVLQWTVDSGPWTDSHKIITVSPNSTSIYTATLTDNCTNKPDSAKTIVIVRPPLQVNSTAKDSICQNQLVLLSASLSGGLTSNYSLLWTTDGGPWTSIQNPATDNPQLTTTYTASLSDNCSPTVKTSKKVIVLPTPKADFEVLPKNGCPPLLVALTDNSSGNDTLLNGWKVELSEPKGVSVYNHTFINPGSYSVGLSVSNTLGCSDYILKKNVVTVFDKPEAGFAVKPDIKEIESPLLLYNYSQRATSYTWHFGDGNSLYQNNRNDTTYSYKDTGGFDVKLIAENEKGCRDTLIQNIRVFDKINCVIPSAFTPGNADNLNPVFAPVCAGIALYHITIYNRWGQVIFDCENCAWDGTFDNTPVPAGVYMYKLQLNAESHKKSLVFGMVNVIR